MTYRPKTRGCKGGQKHEWDEVETEIWRCLICGAMMIGVSAEIPDDDD